MKRILHSLIFLLVVVSTSHTAFAQGYEIKIQLRGMENQELYMGHYYAEKTYVMDTVKADAQGNVVFKDDKEIDGGIYYLVLPSKSIAFEFLVTEDQHFSLSTDTLNYLDHLVVTGSKENELYLDYSRFMRDKNQEMSKLQEKLTAAKDNKKETEEIYDKIKVLQEAVKTKWDSYVADNPGTFFANIVKAQMFPELPEFEVDPSITNKDSALQVMRYYYNKNHFFDNIDFTDMRLLRTAYLYNRLQTYFTKMVFNPDTIIKDGDRLIKLAEPSKDMYRYMVEYMLNLKYETNRMGMDKVLVHVGEEYYLSGRAEWVDSARMEKIKERIIKTRPNVLGEKAKDMKLVTDDNQIINLYQMKSEYIIIAFWEPGCGHCKKTLPKLHEIYTHLRWDLDWDIEVLAIFTQVQEHEKWTNFIEEHAMTDWINAYDPYGWAKFRDNYDIYSTPVIYLLDKDKKIIAKRIDVESIEEFIENHKKYNKDK